MDDNVNEILDGLPPKPPRSRLDPHAALIEEMRRRGRTYKEIARVLAEVFQLHSSPSNIYYFVQHRAKVARQARVQKARTKAESSHTVAFTQKAFGNPASQPSSPTDVMQRIAAFKNRRVAEEKPEGFHFDPNEPLRLINPEKKKPGD